MAAAAEQKDGGAALILAPLPETKRGYGIHLYPSKQDTYAYGNGKTVIIRSFADPSVTKLFHEHKANVNVAAFSPNGEYVASGDAEGKVIIWSVLTGIVKAEVPICTSVLDIAWDADGKRVCAVGDGKQDRAKVFMWDTGSNLGKVDGHNKPILSVAYRKHRPYKLVTASEDLTLRVFEGPPFKFDHSFGEHGRYPNRVRYSPDGNSLISVGADSKIFLFDASGQKIKEIEDPANGHKAAIYGFDWSPDSKSIITVSSDKTAKIWNVDAGNVVHTVAFGNDVNDMQMGALWHKEWCLTVSLSGQINYINTDNGTVSQVVSGHKASINDISLDAARGVFFTADTEGAVCKWDYATNAAVRFTGKGHGKAVKGVRVTADGANLVTVGLDDKIRVSPVAGLAFSEKGQALGGSPNYLVVGRRNANLAVVALAQDKIVIARGGQVVNTIDLKYSPLVLALNADDSQLLVGGKDKKVHLYTLAGDNINEKAAYEGHTRQIAAVGFHPGSGLPTSADGNRTIYHWDGAGAFKNNSGWTFHSATPNDLEFNEDGSKLATCAQDETIIIWKDLVSYKHEMDVLQLAHKGGVLNVRWWDANTVLSVGADRSIKKWVVA